MRVGSTDLTGLGRQTASLILIKDVINGEQNLGKWNLELIHSQGTAHTQLQGNILKKCSAFFISSSYRGESYTMHEGHIPCMDEY